MQDPNFQRKIVNVGSSTYSCYPLAVDQIYKIQQDKAVSSTNSYKQQRKQQHNQMTKWVNIEEKAETEIEQCQVDFKNLQQEEEKFQLDQDNDQKSKPAIIKQSEEFTHFVSIPLNYHEFLDSVYAFQTDILYNIDEKYKDVFTQQSKSHVTLCMLKLSEQEHQEKAVQIMKDCQDEILKIINAEPLEISLQGLGYFSINKDLKKEQATARVVYTKIQKGQGLTKIRKITDLLIKKFLNSGIIEEKDLQASHIIYEKNSDMYELKQIHITLMKQQKAHSVDQSEFEVAEIMKRHQNFKFATLQIHKIDISIRGEVDSDEFYKPLFRIQI